MEQKPRWIHWTTLLTAFVWVVTVLAVGVRSRARYELDVVAARQRSAMEASAAARNASTNRWVGSSTGRPSGDGAEPPPRDERAARRSIGRLAGAVRQCVGRSARVTVALHVGADGVVQQVSSDAATENQPCVSDVLRTLQLDRASGASSHTYTYELARPRRTAAAPSAEGQGSL